MHKVKVAMPHGDYQGVGYTQLLRMLDTPDMLELCNLTVYGVPQLIDNNAPGIMDQHIKMNIISQIADADEGRLNIIDCTPADSDDAVVPTSFADLGYSDKTSRLSALKTMAQAICDVHQGAADVVVSLPAGSGDMAAGKPHFIDFAYERIEKQAAEQVFTMYLAGQLRATTVSLAATADEAMSQTSSEQIASRITDVNQSLRRDFMISCPRIAIIGIEGADSTPITAAIATHTELHHTVFGPYPEAILGDATMLQHFDAVVAMYPQQIIPTILSSENGNIDEAVAFLAGADIVCTAPAHNALYEQASTIGASEKSLRNAIYAAIDIYHCRIEYDKPYKNPLPKLYHEHREDGERPRFAAKKPFDATEPKKDAAEQKNDSAETATKNTAETKKEQAKQSEEIAPTNNNG